MDFSQWDGNTLIYPNKVISSIEKYLEMNKENVENKEQYIKELEKEKEELTEKIDDDKYIVEEKALYIKRLESILDNNDIDY